MRILAWFAAFIVVFGVIIGFELHAFSGLGMSSSNFVSGYTVILDGALVHVSLARTMPSENRAWAAAHRSGKTRACFSSLRRTESTLFG